MAASVVGVACLFLTGCRDACEHAFRARPRAALWVRFTELGKPPSRLHDVRRMARAGTLFGSFTLAYRFTTSVSGLARERLDRVLSDHLCQFLDSIRWLRRSGSGWQPFFAVNWRRPGSNWKWLLLVSPAFVLLAFFAYGWWLVSHYPSRPSDAVVFRGMITYACLCPILGFYSAWSFRRWFLKVLVGICYTIGLLVLNWFLGFSVWNLIQHATGH